MDEGRTKPGTLEAILAADKLSPAFFSLEKRNPKTFVPFSPLFNNIHFGFSASKTRCLPTSPSNGFTYF
jgi:hypothetical protein